MPRRSLAGTIVKRRRVAAAAANLDVELVALHGENVGDDLFAAAIMAWNRAGHRLVRVDRLALNDLDPAVRTHSPPRRRVVDRDSCRPHRPHLADVMREVGERHPARFPEKDGGEGGALLRRSALVHIERDTPRRAELVVVVRARHDDGQAGEVELVSMYGIDRPAQREVADAVRRPAAFPAADRATGTDRLTGAGLEVRTRDRPRANRAHDIPIPCNAGATADHRARQRALRPES